MSAKRSSARRGIEPLRLRRRKGRQRAVIALAILVLIACGGIVYGLQQSAVRISQVRIVGADQSFAAYATNALKGSYLGLIPRNSIFFAPFGAIRSAILAAHPDVAAVSIARDGFDSIAVTVNERTSIARWCGASPDAPSASCYFFDANGFVFATTSPVIAQTASSSVSFLPSGTSAENSFIVYEPLASATTTPIGATLPHTNQLPAAFDFARKIDSLGSPVVAIVIKGSEADDYLASGTYLRYLLGHEQDAFSALSSAESQVNLADGSVEYVDLRFPGKMYLKKKQ